MRRRPLAQPALRPGRPAFPPGSLRGLHSRSSSPPLLLRGESGLPARLCQDRMAPYKPRLRSQPLDPPFFQQPGTGSPSARCPAEAASFAERGYRCCHTRLGNGLGEMCLLPEGATQHPQPPHLMALVLPPPHYPALALPPTEGIRSVTGR